MQSLLLHVIAAREQLLLFVTFGPDFCKKNFSKILQTQMSMQFFVSRILQTQLSMQYRILQTQMSMQFLMAILDALAIYNAY